MTIAAHPTLHCIHRAPGDSDSAAKVLVSISRGELADSVGELVGRLLSERLRRPFMEEVRGTGASDLAAEAFCDLMHSSFSSHATFVAAVGPPPPDGSFADSDPEWLDFLAALKPVTWLFHGLADVRGSPAGRLLVRFGDLPGAIEFDPSRAAAQAARFNPGADDTSVCYGFGYSDRHPADVVEALRDFAHQPRHLATSIWHAVHV